MSIGIKKTFNVDMVPGGAPPIIHVSAEDVGRPYRANLLYNGEVYEVQGNSLTIAGTKPDGTVFEYPVDDFERDESYADFTIKKQMAIVPGTVRCKLREYLNDDQIGSATFILDVDEYVYDPEAASESYIPTFETAIQEALENVADDIADLATAAAGSATSAQTSAGTATTAAGSATSAAEEAEDSADRAEAAAESMAAYNTDRTPYLLRQSGGGVETGDREYDTIVGGTVAWNQLANSTIIGETLYGITLTNNNNGSYTLSGTATGKGRVSISDISAQIGSLLSNHIYYCKAMPASGFTPIGSGNSVYPYAGVAGIRIDKGNGGIYKHTFSFTSTNLRIDYDTGVVFDNAVVWPQWIDLTQMFGSTIADYIYSLEQATAGAGVAWFRQYFPEDYYEYNAGELKSVSGVSAHVMRDGNDNIIGSYPLDDSLTLRGIPKLDGSKLYYDGDTYESNGTVTRKYGVRAYQSGDESLADAITDGTNTVYKLTTPTTETADPFTNPQVVDQNGTEEYVTDSIVPVGHDTRYRVNLLNNLNQILKAPTADGTYTMKVTVSNGVATYSWTSQ